MLSNRWPLGVKFNPLVYSPYTINQNEESNIPPIPPVPECFILSESGDKLIAETGEFLITEICTECILLSETGEFLLSETGEFLIPEICGESLVLTENGFNVLTESGGQVLTQ